MTHAAALLIILGSTISVAGCARPAPPSTTRDNASPTVHHVVGSVQYENGDPASMATIAITDLGSGALSVVTAARDGKFTMPIAPGEYAFAAATDRGAAWLDKVAVTDREVTIKLTAACSPVKGRVSSPGRSDTQVRFARFSVVVGDTFVAQVRADGSFSLCLLPGKYQSFLTGGLLSIGVAVAVPSTTELELHGYEPTVVKSRPQAHDRIAHDIAGLVADIERRKPRLVGMGEATHGTAEFATTRATLTLELARRSRLRLVLLENDAIAGAALDDYVNGKDIDLSKAVAALRFWTTDTHEFHRALQDIRAYNLAQAASTDRIHIWGIDVQNTELPSAVLISNQSKLKLTSDDVALLQEIARDRAKGVKQFTPERRAALDALLLRLATPLGPTDSDTQIAVAARSLAVQVGYMDGDLETMYGERRDLGMAQLAQFILERTGVELACVWAHDGHVTRGLEAGPSMGRRLSALLPNRYYPVGFFMFEGSSRAWDPGGKIGVIPHPVKPAPPYTLEGAIMAVTGSPDVAWVPFATLPKALRTWLDAPRFVRQLGAVYNGEDNSMRLSDIGGGYDAVVVIRTAHDSTPTPTGIRKAKT